jgi:hypothetical protein
VPPVRYESTVEYRFYNELLKWGVKEGILIEVLKLNVVGRRGWPDRMILWQGEHVLFIEFKRPGEEARPLQSYIHQVLRRMGFSIAVFEDTKKALDYAQAKIRATTPPNGSPDPTDEGGGSPPLPKAG